MGMYDSVFASCPRCNKSVEFQSKAGKCHLNTFNANSVPVVIAEDLNGDIGTCECGTILKLILDAAPANVKMLVAVEN